MKISAITVKNFKCLKDVHLDDIPNVLFIVGKNGSGKSSFFDVFSFVHECMIGSVNEALAKRGGFDQVLSQNADNGKIFIKVKYLIGGSPVFFSIEIDRMGSHIDFSEYRLNDSNELTGYFIGLIRAFHGWDIMTGKDSYNFLVNNDGFLESNLICVETPEQGVHPILMPRVIDQIRFCVMKKSQSFITTHSPDMLNLAKLDEVIWLAKKDGNTEIRRAKDDKQVAAYMADGDKMGYLWSEGFFTGI